MRYPKEHKERTRERILEAAGRVFRREGFARGGVAAVMKEAGLTHGGFYAHFDSKEALLSEVVRSAVRANRRIRTAGCEHLSGRDWVLGVAERYLSEAHRDAAEQGCPTPPLLSELGRSTEGPRWAFSEALAELEDEFGQELAKVGEQERELALGVIAACVGGLTISRAAGDEQQSREVLASARRLIRRALGSEGGAPTGGAGESS